MAKVDIKMPDEFLLKVSKLGSDFDPVAEKVLKAGDKVSNIGEFIKEKRKQTNYSQAALAQKCGLKHDSAVCNIEKGERKVTWEELGMISQVLGNFHVFDALVAAGFISEEDINPVHRLYHLDELTSNDIEDVQKYIEFLIFKHPKENKEG